MRDKKSTKSMKSKLPNTLKEYEEQLMMAGKEMPAPSGKFDKSAKARAARSMGCEDTIPVKEEDTEKPKPKKKKKQKGGDQDEPLAIVDTSPVEDSQNDDGSDDDGSKDMAFWIDQAKIVYAEGARKKAEEEKIDDSDDSSTLAIEDSRTLAIKDSRPVVEKKKKKKKSMKEKEEKEVISSGSSDEEEAPEKKKSPKLKEGKNNEPESEDDTGAESALTVSTDESLQPEERARWKLLELRNSGSVSFETLGRTEKVKGKSIRNGITKFKANPGKYLAMTYQTNESQNKYNLIHRAGTKKYKPQGLSDKGWMTVLLHEYESLPPYKNNILPKQYRDEYTDDMSYGGYKLHHNNNLPVLPGRGMGIGDSPDLKIIGDVDPSDIEQGSVGDCWLLSGISSLAEFDGAVKHLFRKTKNLDERPFEEPNMYTITLWDLTTWKEVDIAVDERLCVTADGSGNLLGSKPSADGELWVCYLEKALAIHCGGWDKISGGQCTHAWALMTGCKEQYTIAKNKKTGKYICMAKYNPYKEKWLQHGNSPHDGDASVYQVPWPEVGGGGGKEKELSEDELFLKLCAWDEVNYIVGAGTTGSSDKSRTDGMVDNHAYSVIESVNDVAGTGIGLIKVRNPWGKGEIEDGMFDDDGPGWDKYPQIKKALNPVVADDGIFWVTKQEFFKYFQTVYLSASNMTEFKED
jgi:hypothetical protein